MEPFYGDKKLAEQLLGWRDALGIGTVVETGTGFGCDTQWFGRHFSKVYTIEIQPNLAHRARTLFKGTNVQVVQGEAGKTMSSVADKIPRDEPVLFFFNAYRKDKTLLTEELKAALQSHPNFLVIVNEILVPDHPEYVHCRWDDRHEVNLRLVSGAMDVCSPGWRYRFLEADAAAAFQVGRLAAYPLSLENNVI